MSPEPTTKAPAATADPRSANRPQGGQRQQGRRPRQQSRYGQQLQEKQNLKELFGIRDGQLRKYYTQALRVQGQTGPMLISLLERRLDNAIFRAGFAQTRPQARQMATHRLFAVNGRAVDVPSYELKAGDVVSVRETKRNKSYFSQFEKRMQNASTPSWILINPQEFSFKIESLPSFEEANVGVDIRAVLEFFAH
ncbi:MAG TPA: 30S ribosomal protein S4 [Candidatus Andersenbacteria bacterium]|nr:30S ribosomal protein S4 [Candidatus Andersenbacteria bacterium]